ncbi:gephyrin-like molybdotransferase Glp [Leifsonia sp. NPDC014704]|uniref:molybdopterin molybdotransferase MoeA n=1 Tax=Leifsonia sp. NPDC014704 TaxID=3364123 RepID=UPI0036F47D4B
MDATALTVDGYRAAVLEPVRPLPAEEVALVDAVGRVTARELAARQPVPLFDNSAMDGYAVRAADLVGASAAHPVTVRVADGARAGDRRPAPLRPGEAVRVMTGAPLPAGADLVVPVELTVAGRFTGDATVTLWPSAKSNIRRAGEDVAAGAPLLPAATPLTARALALLAATGHSTVEVRRRPRIAVVSSGDELAGAEPSSRDQQDVAACVIPDSNAVYLTAAARSLGCEVSGVHRAGDTEEALRAALDAASQDADLIVSTGGLGAGTHDLLGRLVAASPGGMLARVAMRPGRPQAHGSWSGVPWLALPGTPTAAFVSFEAFVRPVLDRLAGRATTDTSGAEVVSSGWAGSAGAVRYVPLAVTDRGDGVSVTPVGAPGAASHALSAMFTAPLIGVVGADIEDVVAGQLLPVIAPA